MNCIRTRPVNKFIEIFTDGACRGNPGPGGWGALLRYAAGIENCPARRRKRPITV